MSRAVFLDRDGTINEIVHFPELGILDSPLTPYQFKLLSGVPEAIRAFNGLGLKVIIVSNQPAVAKGKMTMELFEQIQRKMRMELSILGAKIDGEYYCLHHPQAEMEELRIQCDCRKPKPGLILRAASIFGLDLSRCYMVGDGLTDILAGEAAGCITILIGNAKCDLCRFFDDVGVEPDYIVPDILHASKIIESQVAGREVIERSRYSLIRQV